MKSLFFKILVPTIFVFFPLLCEASAISNNSDTYNWAYHGSENHYGKRKKKPKAPLDGGLSLLAAAGIGYGVKKYAAKKKQEQNKAVN